MKVCFIAAEAAPFVKVGGLGDVIGSLPKSLRELGVDARVILPLYSSIDRERFGLKYKAYQFVDLGWRHSYCGIFETEVDGVPCYFVDNEQYFNRDSIYGQIDDGERFAFFQLATLEAMERVGFIPDVLHAHDYHTAMIPFLLKEKYRWIQAYQGIKTVLTIHNLEFQGQFSESMLWDLFRVGFERYADGTVRWNDCLNWMKAGILYADRVTTVSPSYAYEIMTTEFGCGIDQILRMESGKLSGIVNGIDTDLYNPQTDPLLDYHFDQSDLTGKAKNKAKLQEKVGLPVRDDVPLIGIVSRLTRQKGFDLVVESLHRMLQEDIQIVLLGTGDPGFEQAFSWFGQVFPDKLSANITFDVKLAQEIYAACDLFLMPSRFEPCGLSQMMAMRYGTLPLVHEVGGLRDTVQAYNPVDGSGTGFSFDNLTPFWLNWALQTALDVYQNHPATWKKLQLQAMERDFSWDTACQSYLHLYQSLVN